MIYLVEVTQHLTTPITVEADSEQHAIELVLRQRGEAGDQYYPDPSFKVRLLEEGD